VMEKRVIEIERRISEALSHLAILQQLPHGFETLKLNPHSDGGVQWQKELKNAFVSANILLPLTLLNNKTASQILTTEYNLLEANRNRFGLWHYFSDTSAPFFIPFETDTNSLFSCVSQRINKKPVNKDCFYQQLSKNGLYNLWFLPKTKILLSSPLYYLNLKQNWNKAQKHLAFQNNVVKKTDAEFCVTANVLLYLGDNVNTQPAIAKLIEDINSQQPIKLLYYPNQIIALYLFARAYYYGNIKPFQTIKSAIEQRLEEAYEKEIGGDKFLNLLTATISLIYNSSNTLTDKAIEESWNLFDQIQTPFPFYCSNSETDFNTSTKLHNAYFGAPALTAALYLEFLYLLRLRKEN
jgi:hypothetical protein